MTAATSCRRPPPLLLPLLVAAFSAAAAASAADWMGSLSQALLLGLNSTDELSFRECVWRRGGDRDACPDPDVHLYFYTSANASRVEVPQTRAALARGEWLRQAEGGSAEAQAQGSQSQAPVALLVHGYAGGDGLLPAVVLRDAYLRSGRFRVLVADWGALCRPPCYPAAVHNLRPAAACLARQLSLLRQLAGVSPSVCVGHSLGAHLCGLLARQLRFRLPAIIGVDPARPLVRAALRLSQGDAGHVQTLHTNAGHYGEAAVPRMAHASVCLNGGRLQPFCLDKTDPHLCSHVRAVCLLAETLQPEGARRATYCGRRCVAPAASTSTSGTSASTAYSNTVAGSFRPRPGSLLAATEPGGVLFGHLLPPSASGSFCATTAEGEEPFCPRFQGDAGDRRCCSRPPAPPAAPAASSAPPPQADRPQEAEGAPAPLLAWQLATAAPAPSDLRPATVSQGYATVKG